MHPPHERCSTGVLTASHVSMQWQSSCGQDGFVGNFWKNGDEPQADTHITYFHELHGHLH